MILRNTTKFCIMTCIIFMPLLSNAMKVEYSKKDPVESVIVPSPFGDSSSSLICNYTENPSHAAGLPFIKVSSSESQVTSAWSPDCNKLAASITPPNEKSYLEVYTRSGAQLNLFKKYPQLPANLCLFHDDNTTLGVSGQDTSLTVLDTENDVLCSLPHTGYVQSMAWGPDSQQAEIKNFAASCTFKNQNFLEIFKVRKNTGTLMNAVPLPSTARLLTWLNHSMLLVGGYDTPTSKKVDIFNPDNGQHTHTINGSGTVYDIQPSVDTTLMALLCMQGSNSIVEVWDTNGQKKKTFSTGIDANTTLFAPDNTSITVLSSNNTYQTYDL